MTGRRSFLRKLYRDCRGNGQGIQALLCVPVFAGMIGIGAYGYQREAARSEMAGEVRRQAWGMALGSCQGVAGGDTRFQVLARVTDVRRHVGITLKADVPDDTMTIESWFTVYAGANWHERETHEMFGINFAGHPDLRNIYLPTEFEGYPLRKDFPLLSRMVKPWPGIVDVEPMPVEEAEGLVADETAAPEVAE